MGTYVAIAIISVTPVTKQNNKQVFLACLGSLASQIRIAVTNSQRKKERYISW
jgi:hypothetical protein